MKLLQVNCKFTRALSEHTHTHLLLQNSSAACLGYFQYPSLKYFIEGRTERRQPLINRGYYCRVVAIRQIITEFLSCVEQGVDNDIPFQIVNLGCGMTPLYFWLTVSTHRQGLAAPHILFLLRRAGIVSRIQR